MPPNDGYADQPVPHGHGPLHPLLTVAVQSELDVIASRLRARQIAALCGFGINEQARVATAVSEMARNAVAHAAGGKVRFFLGTARRSQALVVTIDDQGPGIPGWRDPDSAEAEPGGASVGGIAAARRFMDALEIVTGARGTRVLLAKKLPPHVAGLRVDSIGVAVSKLEALPSNVALSEAHQQNRELTHALAALQAKQTELIDVSAHLERTNRQVEALNLLLKEKADSLVSADRRKDEFLSILSHELRGPLSAAGMAASLLESGGDSAQSVRLGQLVARQVTHMSRLVEDLLDVSRVSRGLVSIRRHPVDLRDVVEAAVEQLASAAQDKRHAVGKSLPPHPCMVEGDRTRLIQIVANLLGNAIRYTPDGGRIEVLVALEDNDVLLRVTDDGIGIPSALMPHLFDLYTQAEHAPGARNSGLGLGLALVKSLVEAHGGSVGASSAGSGQGSRFDIRLARAAGHARPGAPAP